ncbi:MAG: hypothetical protein DI537_42535 [Stutzerimonas stutzeri]|nr:MAG: hypothetical protein DI537_42535 [Stutzerimonas stutzeri]
MKTKTTPDTNAPEAEGGFQTERLFQAYSDEQALLRKMMADPAQQRERCLEQALIVGRAWTKFVGKFSPEVPWDARTQAERIEQIADVNRQNDDLTDALSDVYAIVHAVNNGGLLDHVHCSNNSIARDFDSAIRLLDMAADRARAALEANAQ